MRPNRRTAVVATVALIMSAALAAATSASARDRRVHPPIHVATPTGGSPITPYFFPYGGRYRYNSPGPVFARLHYWGPDVVGCRLWRYNYLYWVC
jgi:hypothetical protein